MRNWRTGAFAIAVVLSLSAENARAQLLNPGFETGSFTSWTTTGDTTVVGAVGSVTPDSGNFQAQITNGAGAVPVAALEAFLGLAPGAFNALGYPAMGGAASKQTLNGVAVPTLTV